MSNIKQPITINKDSELFLGIGTHNDHSFMFIGAMQKDEPVLLGKIGQLWDVDLGIFNDAACTSLKVITSKGVLARIGEEGFGYVEKRSGCQTRYQAYTISFEQLQEYLFLIQQIEKKQRSNLQISAGIKRIESRQFERYVEERTNAKSTDSDEALKKRSYAGIRCYTPDEIGDSITFTYGPLSEYKSNFTEVPKSVELFATNMSQTNFRTNCRTSAKEVSEATLKFTTAISRLYCIKPAFKTLFWGGGPVKDSFYILPPPPNAYGGFNEGQMKVLHKIYCRIEKIPCLNPSAKTTRDKFNELKGLYVSLVKTSTASAADLLNAITSHIKSRDHFEAHIATERGCGASMRKFFGAQTATKTLLVDIQAELSSQKKL